MLFVSNFYRLLLAVTALALTVLTLGNCSGASPASSVNDGAVSQYGDFGLVAYDLGASSVDVGTPTGCNGGLECVNQCIARSTDDKSRAACLPDCRAASHAGSSALLGSLFDCLAKACPSALPTDVCFAQSDTACTSCYQDNQVKPGGMCLTALAACVADLP